MRLALISALLLAGCVAAAPERIDTAASPALSWEPTTTPRADVLALHGFGDHKGTFADLGRFLTAHDIAVHAYDLRGFGQQPDAGFWPGIDALLDQLDEQMRTLRQVAPDRPLLVLGDSMGAAVLTLAAARGKLGQVDGMVLVAPAVWGGATLSGFYRATLSFTRRFLPWLRLSGRGLPVRASDNIEVLRARGRDPLFLKEPLVGMVAGLVELMDEARAAAPAVGGRVLVLIGDKDQVVPPDAQRSFAASIGAPDCRLVDYPDGWHLLLHDLQRQRVLEDLLAWLDGAEPLPARFRDCRGTPS